MFIKLMHHNVPVVLLKVLINCYDKCTVFVRWNNALSRCFLANVNCLLYVAVCPSFVCLYVMFVRCTQATEIFRNVSMPFCTLMTLNGVIALILRFFSPNSIALQADYVTVILT